MIRRLLQWVAHRFEDKDWLHEQRRQEVLANREAQHITRRLRLDFPVETDIFPPIPKRKSGGTCR